MLALNYATLLVVVVGVPGNLLMFIIYTNKHLTKLAASVYFRVIALSDLLIIANFLKLFVEDVYSLRLQTQSEIVCKLTKFIGYFLDAFSAWCLTAVAFDGFITVFHTPRLKFTQKPHFAMILILIFIAHNLLFYFDVLLLYNLVPIDNSTLDNVTTSFECATSSSNSIVIMDFMNSTLVPFAIMFALTLMTVSRIQYSRNRMRRFSLTHQSSQMRDVKFTMTVILLNAIFLILNVPSPLVNTLTYYNLIHLNQFTNKLLARFFLYLRNMFYATIFYLQLAVNTIVRNQFLKLFQRLKSQT